MRCAGARKKKLTDTPEELRNLFPRYHCTMLEKETYSRVLAALVLLVESSSSLPWQRSCERTAKDAINIWWLIVCP